MSELRPFSDRRKNRRFWRILDRAARRNGLTLGAQHMLHFKRSLDAIFFAIWDDTSFRRDIHFTGMELVQNGQSAPRLARCVVVRMERTYGVTTPTR